MILYHVTKVKMACSQGTQEVFYKFAIIHQLHQFDIEINLLTQLFPKEVGHYLSFAILLENLSHIRGALLSVLYKLFKANPTYIQGSAFTLTGALHVTAGIKLICADNIVTNPHSHWDQHWVTIGIFILIMLDYY
jgi:hypothetical protein